MVTRQVSKDMRDADQNNFSKINNNDLELKFKPVENANLNLEAFKNGHKIVNTAKT